MYIFVYALQHLSNSNEDYTVKKYKK